MAKTSVATFKVTVSDTVSGISTTDQPPDITNTAAPSGGRAPIALTASPNTITPPTGAIGVMLVPPATSTNVKTLKGVSGDTGILWRPDKPILFYFSSATFVILSAGTETIDAFWL